jgi:hypothetical protein
MHQVHKIITGRDHAEGLLELAATGERITRQMADPLRLKVPMGRLEIRRQFFTNRVPAQWNSIPLEIRAVNSLDNFKRKYKEYRVSRLAAANQ